MANKFGAKKCEADGYKFDSLRERERYFELRKLEKAGEITGLKVHPKFTLLSAFYDVRNNLERAWTYTADFAYCEVADCQEVVEDVKSPPTARKRDFILTRKMFKHIFQFCEFRVVF